MYHASRWYGRRGAAIHAMAGVDTALWDIVGQHRGLDGILVGEEQSAFGVRGGKNPAVDSGLLQPFPKCPPHRVFVIHNQDGIHVIGLCIFMGMLLFWELRLFNVGVRTATPSRT